MAPKVARPTRYVFAELTPFARLVDPSTLELLAERDIMLYVAVTPPTRARAAEIVRRCREAGVAVGVWPMIDDQLGRWASAWTGVEYAPFCRQLVADLESAGALPDELLVDLEPPIELVREALQSRGLPPLPPRHRAGRGLAALIDVIAELDRSGLAISAAAAPWAVGGAGRRGWQRLLGTPIDGLPFTRVFIMAYTSLLEGYSRGLLERRDAEALLARWTRESLAALGPRAAVAIGCVGAGALGDEACYRQPSELARDVSIVTSSGAEHIALFNLGGALERPPTERWFDALTGEPELTSVAATFRASVAGRALSGSGWLLGWAARLSSKMGADGL